MLSRQEIEQREREFLASYAMKSAESRGRVHTEEEHPLRSVYQRDRDRIIHCTAFRRLEYKTQVFVNHEGDHYRTRLTHTLEVAQIARTIAKALRLNEELTEAIALAHDVGHTPFGHSGEEALKELMGEEGFEHNRHGLRVVDFLEIRYPAFRGLNLTYEVREGIIKHTTAHDHPEIEAFQPDKNPVLEAQVVEVADEIAYNNHDLDDGLYAGILSEDEMRSVPLWREALCAVGELTISPKVARHQRINYLINYQATRLLQHSSRLIADYRIRTVDDVRNAPVRLISFDEQTESKLQELRDYLYRKVYRHYRVVRMAEKAKRFVEELFEAYLGNPEQLPPDYQNEIPEQGLKRVICDYIAGMTDRYAQDEYKRLFYPYERV